MARCASMWAAALRTSVSSTSCVCPLRIPTWRIRRRGAGHSGPSPSSLYPSALQVPYSTLQVPYSALQVPYSALQDPYLEDQEAGGGALGAPRLPACTLQLYRYHIQLYRYHIQLYRYHIQPYRYHIQPYRYHIQPYRIPTWRIRGRGTRAPHRYRTVLSILFSFHPSLR